MYVKLLLTNLVPCLSPNADDLTLSGQGPANFGMPSVYLHIDVHLLIYVCRDGPVHIPLSWFWRKYCKWSSLYPGGCYSCCRGQFLGAEPSNMSWGRRSAPMPALLDAVCALRLLVLDDNLA